MINALGPSGLASAIDARRGDRVKAGVPAGKVTTAGEGTTRLGTPASELAAQGAPIDTAKVASIKAAIAAGTYRIDPQAIADRMIALDLPAKG